MLESQAFPREYWWKGASLPEEASLHELISNELSFVETLGAVTTIITVDANRNKAVAFLVNGEENLHELIFTTQATVKDRDNIREALTDAGFERNLSLQAIKTEEQEHKYKVLLKGQSDFIDASGVLSFFTEGTVTFAEIGNQMWPANEILHVEDLGKK